jgi:hypothetical protein
MMVLVASVIVLAIFGAILRRQVNLREALIARVSALKKQRTERIAASQREIDAMTSQITAAESLAAQWTTLSPDQAIALLEQTGLRLEVK